MVVDDLSKWSIKYFDMVVEVDFIKRKNVVGIPIIIDSLLFPTKPTTACRSLFPFHFIMLFHNPKPGFVSKLEHMNTHKHRHKHKHKHNHKHNQRFSQSHILHSAFLHSILYTSLTVTYILYINQKEPKNRDEKRLGGFFYCAAQFFSPSLSYFLRFFSHSPSRLFLKL